MWRAQGGGEGVRRGREGGDGVLMTWSGFARRAGTQARARRDDERGALISVTEREELAAVIAPLTALISI